ncbi:single-stranded-DNA-specific exonuclease RecJ [Xenococcus sp. PCC 7305]|uniref:single-stranded-DNA-specific exonuclease RecJ n=1 Tax=Xenococcus sp. PCC 7305 TaxID=102125 RepID=UPI0002ABFD51|nr:single-stranded-DNA-specific exonuclease RecJ [Xenococcus sp. PCC 7305]ELS04698.1 single-stranded-DNA-specific exonuclease RecJ [Xenococcus sp. PCC 7305]
MSQWQLVTTDPVPQWFVDTVQAYTPDSSGKYGAQLLWQRGISDLETLAAFVDPECYQPASTAAFGEEMAKAIARLSLAYETDEKTCIWGDFDADGVTSTSVLWEGLGQFFPQNIQLQYYIPNRLTESHGLNHTGIAQLAASGTKLIVTCDTGSTNLEEIAYAKKLGIDIIVTDHHTLPESRPNVVGIINPRYLPKEHPLYHLSGVAVAYKLVEALYQALPEIPQQPLGYLLDLVAIGLVADLVSLQGDCRYLAQQGIKQLKKQTDPKTANRPGVTRLLELCRRSGDRPTDISFGLGPRINAVSRIHGDASFCVELLTSRDRSRCHELASETELANTRRKELQKNTINQVQKKLQRIDLSTTSVIVLEDPSWQGGVLGLVAGQIAQEHGRPTILLSASEDETGIVYARGSARSVNGIDLYQLVKSQEHLLHRFGGHPFAAGLSLKLENLPLFQEGINQKLNQQLDVTKIGVTIEADLQVRVSDLGQSLFRELSLIEPCGMGNPVPKLLIKNCNFKNVWNSNIKDKQGKKVQYIKTKFSLSDQSCDHLFPGVWWGHYKDEVPQDISCDVIVELDFNSYARQYEVRLIELRPNSDKFGFNDRQATEDIIVDLRDSSSEGQDIQLNDLDFVVIDKCPMSWTEIHKQYHNAIANQKKLALNYRFPKSVTAPEILRQFITTIKDLAAKEEFITKAQLQNQLGLGDRSFALGLQVLKKVGFSWYQEQNNYQFKQEFVVSNIEIDQDVKLFLLAVTEEHFQKEYFCHVPLSIIKSQLTG